MRVEAANVATGLVSVGIDAAIIVAVVAMVVVWDVIAAVVVELLWPLESLPMPPELPLSLRLRLLLIEP